MSGNCTAWQECQVLRQLRIFHDAAGEVEKEVVLALLPKGQQAICRRIRETAPRWLTPERYGLHIQREISAAMPSLVPRVLDECAVNGWWLSTVEFIQGRDLHTYVVQEGYTLRAAVLMACKACAAVEVLEKMGILHNDFKPVHFVVRPDGSIAIIDWGSATRRSESPRAVPRTPLYTPREGPGPQADRWALSATLFHVLAHQPPFAELGSGRVAFHRPAPFPPDWPKPLVGVFERALSLNPAERFQSVRELREALQSAIGFEDRPTRPAPAPVALAAPLLARRAVLIPIGVALTAAAFGIGALAARAGVPAHAKPFTPPAHKAAAKRNPKRKPVPARKNSPGPAVKRYGN